MCLPLQDGQTPRPLHENAMSVDGVQRGQSECDAKCDSVGDRIR
jgi:hypothetical protein